MIEARIWKSHLTLHEDGRSECMFSLMSSRITPQGGPRRHTLFHCPGRTHETAGASGIQSQFVLLSVWRCIHMALYKYSGLETAQWWTKAALRGF